MSDRVTNPCTCKAEHWQPHKVDCPAYTPPVAPSSVSTLRLLAKCGSMDLSALGAIADEMERLRKGLTDAAYALFQIKRMVPEAIVEHSKTAYDKACAILDGDAAEPDEHPVAWLKEWTSVGGAQIHRRVDLTDSCEQWLMNMFPKITPLYARPAEKSNPQPDTSAFRNSFRNYGGGPAEPMACDVVCEKHGTKGCTHPLCIGDF